MAEKNCTYGTPLVNLIDYDDGGKRFQPRSPLPRFVKMRLKRKTGAAGVTEFSAQASETTSISATAAPIPATQ